MKPFVPLLFIFTLMILSGCSISVSETELDKDLKQAKLELLKTEAKLNESKARYYIVRCKNIAGENKFYSECEKP